MEEKWTCSCGCENTGKFCSECGAKRGDDLTDLEYVKQLKRLELQMKQQELEEAQRQRDLMEKKRRENAAKQKAEEEYKLAMNKYREECDALTKAEVSRWGSGWLVLVLAALATLVAVLALINFISAIKSGWFLLGVNSIKVLLTGLVCAGFWRVFASGKSKSGVNPGGVRMLRGVFKFYAVMTYIILILIAIAIIIIAVSVAQVAKDAQQAASAADVDLSGVSALGTGVMVGLVIAIILVIVIHSVYYVKVNGFAVSVINAFDTKKLSYGSGIGAGVMLIIVGTFMFLLTILSNAIAMGVNQIFSSLLNADILSVNVLGVVQDVANSLLYIFGGVCAISYRGLYSRTEAKKKKIPVPKAVTK